MTLMEKTFLIAAACVIMTTSAIFIYRHHNSSQSHNSINITARDSTNPRDISGHKDKDKDKDTPEEKKKEVVFEHAANANQAIEQRFSSKEESMLHQMDEYNKIPKDRSNITNRLVVSQRIISSLKTEDDFLFFKRNLDTKDEALLSGYIQRNIDEGTPNSFGRVMDLIDKSSKDNRIDQGALLLYSGNVSNETIASIDKYLSNNSVELSQTQQAFILNMIENRYSSDVVSLIESHNVKFTYYPDRIKEIKQQINASLRRN